MLLFHVSGKKSCCSLSFFAFLRCIVTWNGVEGVELSFCVDADTLYIGDAILKFSMFLGMGKKVVEYDENGIGTSTCTEFLICTYCTLMLAYVSRYE